MIAFPFNIPNLSGIPSDYEPVTASNDADNCGSACIDLYIQNAGTITVRTVLGGAQGRAIPITAGVFLPGALYAGAGNGHRRCGLHLRVAGITP